jgi:predicted nucleic acid-binding protein
MTAVIADADILSTFGKIGRRDLLLLLFQKVHVAPAVYRELPRAEELGFIWVANVRQAVELLPLTAGQSRETERLFGLYPQLGSGEVESLVLAQTHRLLCLTNDRQAKAAAKAPSLPHLDLEEILRALKTKRILTTEALTELIAQVEEQDHTRIKAKGQILSS